MSYWSLLEDSRRRLTAGDFLEAERLYFQALDEHDSSRLRAPLMEKGVEPMVRWGRRMMGRSVEVSTVPAFAAAAGTLQKDLEDVAELRLKEARHQVRVPAERSDPEDVARLAQALNLHQQSQLFHLDEELLWPVLETYLGAAARHRVAPSADVLEGLGPLSVAQRSWLTHWVAQAMHDRPAQLSAVAPWFIEQLRPLAHDPGHELGGEACALMARLHLFDALGAPRALAAAGAALDARYPPKDVEAVLDLAARLACNADRLAAPLATPQIFSEMERWARRHTVAWPPMPLVKLLESRQPKQARRCLAGVYWEGQPGERVVLLKFDGAAAIDALLLRPCEEPANSTDPFACSMTEALSRVDAWLPTGVPVLCGQPAPAWLSSVLGERPMVALSPLEEVLAPPESDTGPPRAAAFHPLLDVQPDPLAEPWRGLAGRARELPARLATLGELPALGSEWGMRNLRTLGKAGLMPARRLAMALTALAEEDREPATPERVEGTVRLEWPRLVERDWPARPRPFLPSQLDSGDSIVHGRPTLGELVGSALSTVPCQVLAADSDTAEALAGQLAGELDPRHVTLAPARGGCPETLFVLLDGWIEESLVVEQRSLDVLWLYHVLATSPEGDLERWLQRGGRTEPRRVAMERWRMRAGSCGPECRLSRHQGCYDVQLAERRENSLAWIEWSEHLPRLESTLQAEHTLLCEDLVEVVAKSDDEQAIGRLETLMGLAGRARASLFWSRSAPFADALARELSSRLPADRSFHSALADDPHTLEIHVAPRGYAPGAALLGEESRALIKARVSAWTRRATDTQVWMPPGIPAGPWRDLATTKPCTNVSAEPSADAVVVGLLGAPGPLDRAVALLRLCAAASHARRQLICVDPRLADLVDGVWALAPSASILTDVAPSPHGAGVLDRLPGRAVPRWKTALDEGRLQRVAATLPPNDSIDAERIARLAGVVKDASRRGRFAVGGLAREERVLLGLCLAQLSAESADGGPLGVQTTVWIGDDFPSELSPPGLRIHRAATDGDWAEAFADGQLELLVLPPDDLSDATVVERLLERSEIALLLSETDRTQPTHPAASVVHAEALEWMAGLDSRRSPFLMAWLDDGDRREGAPLRRVASQLGGESTALEEEGAWRCQRIRLEDPPWACPHCGVAGQLAHPHVLCGECGRALLATMTDVAAVEEQLLEARVRWLAREGLTGHWLVCARDPAERDALRSGLGIDAAGPGEPLLDHSEELYSIRVLAVEDLWDAPPPEGELLLTGIPDDPNRWSAVLARLRSTGRRHGVLHFMDHPLAWSPPALSGADAQPSRVWGGAILRWTSARAEVEFRAREALEQLDRTQRALLAAGALWRPRLGPRETAELSPLAQALEAGASQPPRGPTADSSVERGIQQLDELLAALIAQGMHFEAGPVRLSTAALGETAQLRRVWTGWLEWLLREGLLVAATESAATTLPAPHASTAVNRWQQSLRTAPTGIPVELPRRAEHHGAIGGKPEREMVITPTEWYLGVAGSGRSTRLLERFSGGDDSEALIVVPSAAGLLRWEQLMEERGRSAGSLNVVTIRELLLVFLRCHHRLGGYAAPPRILHAAATPEGEELRQRLLRETSRRYAAAAGGNLALDLVQLRRLLEGGEAVMEAHTDGPPVDMPLLRRCAEEVRQAAGWVLPGELGELSRRWLVEHPYIGEAWRDRFQHVVIDDVDAFSDEERAFVDRLFPESMRSTAAEPATLPLGHPRRGDGGERRSQRLPREIARAAEGLLRDEMIGKGRVKPRGRDKGRLDRRQVLNLEACVARIEEALQGRDWQRQRVGIVVTYGGDLPRLASRLREIDIPVWPATQVFAAAPAGPRELLMVLVLAAEGPEIDHGLAGALASELLHSAGVPLPDGDRDELGEWVASLWSTTNPRTQHPAQSFLAPLPQLATQLDRVESLREAAARIEATHLTLRVRRDDAAAVRLESYVQERGDRPWHAVLRGIEPVGLIDPLAPGPRVWLLESNDLPGLELDRAFYLCTGHEPAEQHYRVLGRIRETLVVLYSEIDPFAARR